MMSADINANVFINLDDVKLHFKFTDDQDDATLFDITQSANNELKKRVVIAVDDVLQLEGGKFFPLCQDAAFVFCEAEIRRQINDMHEESKIIMGRFESMMVTLLTDMRAIAPVRTSREVVVKDTSFEDDYFAERRYV